MIGPEYEILAFEARTNEADDIQVLLLPIDDINAVLGTEKWLIRQAESEGSKGDIPQDPQAREPGLDQKPSQAKVLACLVLLGPAFGLTPIPNQYVFV